MRVLMTGGGTAGHVNPAIAIANTIKEKEPDAEIAFVCSTQPNDKATDLVPRAGYEKLYKVNICGSYQIWNPKNIKTLCLMAVSASQAKKIIREFKPDVIIGTGGFACYPVLSEGAKMKIPTVVHESNAIPGRAVRKLSKRVDCVMTNFEKTGDALGNGANIMHVGNPIINGVPTSDCSFEKNGKDKRMLLSFGGSLGAETLNRAVADMLEKIADKYPDVCFYHASGKRDYEKMREIFSQRGLDKKENVTLVDYIYDMNERMICADALICRAGAMTLSELALYGKAAILVPSPYVAANHQYKNARAISDKGGAILVEEKDFDSGKLIRETEKLLSDREFAKKLSENISKFATPDANSVIYAKIKELVRS